MGEKKICTLFLDKGDIDDDGDIFLNISTELLEGAE